MELSFPKTFWFLVRQRRPLGYLMVMVLEGINLAIRDPRGISSQKIITLVVVILSEKTLIILLLALLFCTRFACGVGSF